MVLYCIILYCIALYILYCIVLHYQELLPFVVPHSCTHGFTETPFAYLPLTTHTGNKHSSLSKDPRTPHWTVGREEAFYLFSSGPHCAVIGQLSKDLKLVPDGQSGYAII